MKLRLYVAGQSVNSSRALANLTEFCHKRLSGRHHIQVVDVFAEPEKALQDGVILTPTLVVLSSNPPRSLVGSLSHSDSLESLLGSE